MFFPHPKPLPIAPNSKQVPPTSILVVFTYVYISPPHPDLPPARPILPSGTHGI